MSESRNSMEKAKIHHQLTTDTPTSSSSGSRSVVHLHDRELELGSTPKQREKKSNSSGKQSSSGSSVSRIVMHEHPGELRFTYERLVKIYQDRQAQLKVNNAGGQIAQEQENPALRSVDACCSTPKHFINNLVPILRDTFISAAGISAIRKYIDTENEINISEHDANVVGFLRAASICSHALQPFINAFRGENPVARDLQQIVPISRQVKATLKLPGIPARARRELVAARNYITSCKVAFEEDSNRINGLKFWAAVSAIFDLSSIASFVMAASYDEDNTSMIQGFSIASVALNMLAVGSFLFPECRANIKGRGILRSTESGKARDYHSMVITIGTNVEEMNKLDRVLGKFVQAYMRYNESMEAYNKQAEDLVNVIQEICLKYNQGTGVSADLCSTAELKKNLKKAWRLNRPLPVLPAGVSQQDLSTIAQQISDLLTGKKDLDFVTKQRFDALCNMQQIVGTDSSRIVGLDTAVESYFIRCNKAIDKAISSARKNLRTVDRLHGYRQADQASGGRRTENAVQLQHVQKHEEKANASRSMHFRENGRC